MFTDGQTCKVGSVGQAVLFLIFFFPGSKNDPQNMKILKKSDIFYRKVLGKYFDLFSKIFSQNF